MFDICIDEITPEGFQRWWAVVSAINVFKFMRLNSIIAVEDSFLSFNAMPIM